MTCILEKYLGSNPSSSVVTGPHIQVFRAANGAHRVFENGYQF